VAFNWQDQSSLPIAGYYLQIARSPYFASDSILVDRGSIAAREFRLAGMLPGNYYWRLKATSRSGQTSEWSEPWRFNIVRPDASGMILVDNWGFESVGGTVYIISGRTHPGLRVRAAGREAFVGGDGSFRLQVSAPGDITVEVSDDHGNRSGYVVTPRSGRVTRRF
ncbi:MAG: hypothetical protein LC734_04295, partial [Acidobacteria bacterium]|nr:hypothetical protein [Acidobacteriota bacterium]